MQTISVTRRNRLGGRAPARALAISVMVGLLATHAQARDRVMRVYDEKDGLAVSEISALAQDARGFIWIGTMGGLVRFDGQEMRPWAPDRIRHVISVLSTSPGGDVLAGARTEPLYEVTGDGVEPVVGPTGSVLSGWVDAAYAGDGSLWIAESDTILRRDPAGRWTRIPSAKLGSSGNFKVLPDSAGAVFAAAESAFWRVEPDGSAREIAPLARVNLVAHLPDRSLVLLTRAGALYRIANGAPELLIRGAAHGRGLAVRDGVIWASIDQYVYALRSGRAPEVVAPRPGVPTGRPILVDREGALWLGGYRGIVVFPEPETVTWNDLDGLPSPTHARFLVKAQGAIWISTWYGAGWIEERDGIESAHRFPRFQSGFFCPDGSGALWNVAADSLLTRRAPDGVRTYRIPGLYGIYASSLRRDRSLWLATNNGIVSTGPGRPRAITASAPAGWRNGWIDSWLSAIYEDRTGELWIGTFDVLCHAPAAQVDAGGPVSWACDSLPGADDIYGILRMPSGDVWVATGNEGVLHRVHAGWEELGGSRKLASPRIYGIIPSSSGGVWVLADGSLVRVRERPDLPEGWEVVERLTSWQGIPNQQASDLYEEADGRLWLATLAGVVEVPAAARQAAKIAPPVELVEESVDGRRLPLGGRTELPHRRNRLEIRFAALSYRDRSLIRYQVRTRHDGPWFDSAEPSFRFVDLSPGRHMAEIRASLDGVHWSPIPARIEFTVDRPWYLQLWALSLFALAAAAGLLAAHRIRVGFLLRLERQRTRIAMDLHDEMGSGLGSIGILAGLVSDEALDEAGRRGASRKIAEVAGELGTALTDIVWSLKQGSETLQSLAYRLAERGGRLFPNSRPEFRTELPERWPAAKLPLEVRRNLQLIALEAMHNAARHSGAARVVLGLRSAGNQWCLWVADDGGGIPAAASRQDGRGHGLRNMSSRAAQIGASFSVHREGGRGTVVEVFFDLRSRARPRFERPREPLENADPGRPGSGSQLPHHRAGGGRG